MRQAEGRAALARLLGRPGYYSPRIWGSMTEAGTPEQVLDIVIRARQARIAPDCEDLRVLAARWQRNSLGPEAERLLAIGCGEPR